MLSRANTSTVKHKSTRNYRCEILTFKARKLLVLPTPPGLTRHILDCEFVTNLITRRAFLSHIPAKLLSITWKYQRSKFSKTAADRHLGFDRTVNSVIRSAVPENPTPEPNTKWIGWPVVEILPFEISKWEVGQSLVVNISLFATLGM